MSYLKPRARLKVYEYILDDLILRRGHGLVNLTMSICNRLDKALFDLNTNLCGRAIISDFPELWDLRPIPTLTYWFPLNSLGLDKRIELMEQAIKNVKTLL